MPGAESGHEDGAGAIAKNRVAALVRQSNQAEKQDQEITPAPNHTEGQTTPFPPYKRSSHTYVKGSREKKSSRAEMDGEWREAFEHDFWAAYPRKAGRPAAMRAWRAIKPQNEAMRDAICDGLELWVQFWEADDTPRRYMPHPSTWLNQRRWEDEP